MKAILRKEGVNMIHRAVIAATITLLLLTVPGWASAQGGKKMLKQTATITLEKGGRIEI